MKRLALFALAAQQLPRLLATRRRTWIMLGVTLLLLMGLTLWAAMALMGWMFDQTRSWSSALGDKAPAVARGALEQVEQVVPGARDKLAQLAPGLVPERPPRRDVSGTDLAPVARYPGLARTYWHREGRLVDVSYEGRADYGAVLEHYAQSFAALGYRQELQSATPEAEVHVYLGQGRRFLVKITGNGGQVKVDIETQLP